MHRISYVLRTNQIVLPIGLCSDKIPIRNRATTLKINLYKNGIAKSLLPLWKWNVDDVQPHNIHTKSIQRFHFYEPHDYMCLHACIVFGILCFLFYYFVLLYFCSSIRFVLFNSTSLSSYGFFFLSSFISLLSRLGVFLLLFFFTVCYIVSVLFCFWSRHLALCSFVYLIWCWMHLALWPLNVPVYKEIQKNTTLKMRAHQILVLQWLQVILTWISQAYVVRARSFTHSHTNSTNHHKPYNYWLQLETYLERQQYLHIVFVRDYAASILPNDTTNFIGQIGQTSKIINFTWTIKFKVVCRNHVRFFHFLGFLHNIPT